MKYSFEKKIIAPDTISEEIEELRENKTLVFGNGCFDLFHYGHLTYLYQAKQLGDLLLIAINTDASIKKIKGQNKPYIPLKQRASILAGLEFVDWVTWFSEDSPLNLLERVKPDILVKGGDYKLNQVVGADLVKKYGGKIATVELQEGWSGASLVERIQNSS